MNKVYFFNKFGQFDKCPMKKYLSFFRLRFVMGLQYRAAAWAGIATQFFWGIMEIMIFHAFYRADSSAFPMTFQATASYIWIQQAFLAFFAVWMMEGEVFDSIMNGNVAYELCRPISIYNMWFARSVALRMSRAVLRCMPILVFAAFLPEPFGIGKPCDVATFVAFIFTLIMGLLVTVAFCTLVYMITFFTVSPQGIRILVVSACDLLTGAVIPLPFFPDEFRIVLELLPYGLMQNVPLRVYSGDIAGEELIRAIMLQVIWLIILVGIGKWLCNKAEKQLCIQGG